MTIVQLLIATGALTWAWLAWRAFRFTRGLPNRIRWALWPYKRAKVVRGYTYNGPNRPRHSLGS